MMKKCFGLTIKGKVFLAALESGLISETENIRVLERFNEFWKNAEKIKWDKTEQSRTKTVLAIWRSIAVGLIIGRIIELIISL